MLGPFPARSHPVFSPDYDSDPAALVSHFRGAKATTNLSDAFVEVTNLPGHFRAQLSPSRVDLIGYSQEGLHCRSYASASIGSLYDNALSHDLDKKEAEQYASDDSPVRTVILLAGNYRDTTAWGMRRRLNTLKRCGPPMPELVNHLVGHACIQQLLDSDYTVTLNGAVYGITQRDPYYLNIGTPFDTMVRPWTGVSLPEQEGHHITNVSNVTGGGDQPDHLALPYSPNILRLTHELSEELDGAEAGDVPYHPRQQVLLMYGALPRSFEWRSLGRRGRRGKGRI